MGKCVAGQQLAKVLARPPALRCNAPVFNASRSLSMPHDGTPRRPRSLTFDARSVLLFAALSMGGAALQAQTTSSAGSSSSSPSLRLQAGGGSGGSSPSGTGLRASGSSSSSSGAHGSTAGHGGGASGTGTGSGTHTAQADVHAAFRRADKNQDGKLSPAEASAFPAIGNRFKELDKDRDGSLSPEEFQAGAAS